jgi:hypothetical protein
MTCFEVSPGQGPAPVGANWSKAGTSRDDHRALTLGPHPEVSCRLCHRRSWNRCGSSSPPCCPPVTSTTCWAATVRRSPTGWCSTSSSRFWCWLRLPPHRRRRMLGDHPAPPPRRVDHPEGGRTSRPGGAWRLPAAVRPGARAPGGGRLHYQRTCGGQVAGASPMDRRKQGLKRSTVTDAGGIPLGAVPAVANCRGDGLLGATLDTLAGPAPRSGGCPSSPWCTWTPATTNRPAGRCWPHAAWPVRLLPAGGPHRSRPPALAGGAHPCVGQPVR